MDVLDYGDRLGVVSLDAPLHEAFAFIVDATPGCRPPPALMTLAEEHLTALAGV